VLNVCGICLPLRTQHPIIVHAHAYIMTLSEKLNPSIPMSNWPKRMIRAKTLEEKESVLGLFVVCGAERGGGGGGGGVGMAKKHAKPSPPPPPPGEMESA
jgi:hypothetical protein